MEMKNNQNASTVPMPLPEKSIKGKMASSGTLVKAVQTLSSSNFKTVEQQKYSLYTLSSNCYLSEV